MKPEFWESETMALCSHEARLLMLGLVSNADDEGRVRASGLQIRRFVYPHDDGELGRPQTTVADIERWRDELASRDLVTLYQVSGKLYGHLPGWQEHQRVDHPGKSYLPAPPEDNSRESRESVASPRAPIPDPRSPIPDPLSPTRNAAGGGASSEEYPLPAALDVPAFRAAWQDWQAYRRERNLPAWKPRTIAAKLAELSSWGPTRAVAAIRQSIGNGWSGLFEARSGGAVPAALPAPRVVPDLPEVDAVSSPRWERIVAALSVQFPGGQFERLLPIADCPTEIVLAAATTAEVHEIEPRYRHLIDVAAGFEQQGLEIVITAAQVRAIA
jgi:hypothetical protein